MSLRCVDSFKAPALALAAALLTPALALAGPDWVEQGDAGSNAGTAQIPVRPQGVTSLMSISGALGQGIGTVDLEDMYWVHVVDPVNFRLTPTSANFDAVLWLFRVDPNNQAFGLLANDNADVETGRPELLGSSNDDSGAAITEPGDYLFAITGAGRFPVSDAGPIFFFANQTEISGPDGQGGRLPFLGWAGDGTLQGTYRLAAEHMDFPQLPAPGAAMVMLLGVGAVARRRR